MLNKVCDGKREEERERETEEKERESVGAYVVCVCENVRVCARVCVFVRV